MKTIARFLMVTSVAALFAGCISHNTYSVANVHPVPADIAKSKLLGENCEKVVLWVFGPFGDTSIKKIMEDNKNAKVTLIDYKFSNYGVLYEVCSQVYGY